MKATIINGTIKIGLPKIYQGGKATYIGDFHLQSDEIHREEGFYPVVVPNYDPDLQQPGEIYFDEEKEVFTYPVINLVIDLETERLQKQAEFDEIIEREMTPALMFGVIEKLALGEPIPQEMKDKITSLRDRERQVKLLMNTINDPVKMRKFSFDRAEIEESKEGLKSGRKM